MDLLSYLCLFRLSSSLIGSFLCLSSASVFVSASLSSSSVPLLSIILLLRSFLSPLLLCLSLRLPLPRLRSPSPIPLSSAFLSSAPLGGGGGGSGAVTVLRYIDNRRWSLLLIRGFLHRFYSLFSVPPAVASSSSSLPPTASLLAPPSSSLGLRL